jgi:outer membrane protein assembly factor BamB
MPSKFSSTCSIFLSVTSIVWGGNWAHWRGPAGNGSSPDAKPPTEWSATKNVKWKVPVPGRGSGSPVIWENKVFVVSAVAAKGGRGFDGERLSKLAFKLFCFDRETGKILWQKTTITATPPRNPLHEWFCFRLTLHEW